MNASVLTLLALCAVLLLLGGFLLFAAVGVLAMVWRGGSEPAPPPPVPQPRAAPVLPPSAPPPVPVSPPAPAAPAAAFEDEFVSLQEEDGKTEVFSRGNLNIDWDDDDEEGEATEIFRPDLHGGFNVE